MEKLDRVIAQLHPSLKKFLPRTSSYLMNLYSKEPTKSCQKIHHEYVKLILFSFCNYIQYDEDLTKAYEYAYDCLSQEEFLNKNYLGFIDGKLYDKTYSEDYLFSLIEDAVISFEIPFKNIQKTSPNEVGIFMNYLLKIINHISENTNINSELYCSEYLEQCFLHILKNNLEVYFEYQNSLKNK